MFATFDHYVHLAQSFTEQHKPQLILMHGFSGSGKSAGSELLTYHHNTIRIRSDIERIRLEENVQPYTRYSQERNHATYQQLLKIAQELLSAQLSVVVDATFLSAHYREWFFDAATKLQVPCTIIHTNPPIQFIKDYFSEKSKNRQDPSEATLAVLEAQIAAYQPLSAHELKNTITIDTSLALSDEYLKSLLLTS